MEEQFSEEKMFFKIGEVCSILNLNASQLRFWEKEFQELKPKKNSRGERIYTKEDIALIKTIHYLREEKGYTVPGAKEAIKNKDSLVKRIQLIKKLENLKTFFEEVKKNI